ncbi:unnamed protein product [Caenorhabditis auriculariae]|uniref:Uncharacterized protein n=1 Tax=Caenorhabditis auriculariae TaxID=2777116 RepID=A0A8S1H9T8_9PELO|nr:unnamed protein product [Caenorhabditis auriculariae]
MIWICLILLPLALGQFCPLTTTVPTSQMTPISVYRSQNAITTTNTDPKYRILPDTVDLATISENTVADNAVNTNMYPYNTLSSAIVNGIDTTTNYAKINGESAYTIPTTTLGVNSQINNGQCPSSCLLQLTAFEDPTYSSILHERASFYPAPPYPAFIPAGYRRLYEGMNMTCSPVLNRCGATVPVYRHYRLVPGAIHHAYSLRDATVIPGFAREPAPLCYVWGQYNGLG